MQAAMTGLLTERQRIDPTVDTWSDVNTRMAHHAGEIADAMLEQWRLRYEPDKPPKVQDAGTPDF